MYGQTGEKAVKLYSAAQRLPHKYLRAIPLAVTIICYHSLALAIGSRVDPCRAAWP
jgi:hypothetical protein